MVRVHSLFLPRMWQRNVTEKQRNRTCRMASSLIPLPMARAIIEGAAWVCVCKHRLLFGRILAVPLVVHGHWCSPFTPKWNLEAASPLSPSTPLSLTTCVFTFSFLFSRESLHERHEWRPFPCIIFLVPARRPVQINEKVEKTSSTSLTVVVTSTLRESEKKSQEAAAVWSIQVASCTCSIAIDCSPTFPCAAASARRPPDCFASRRQKHRTNNGFLLKCCFPRQEGKENHQFHAPRDEGEGGGDKSSPAGTTLLRWNDSGISFIYHSLFLKFIYMILSSVFIYLLSIFISFIRPYLFICNRILSLLINRILWFVLLRTLE